MKRITTGFVITFLTFAIGLIATFLYLELGSSRRQKTEAIITSVTDKKPQKDPEIQIINFCQLSANPAEYDGKIVRLSADLTIGDEGAWFTDSACSTTQITTLVFGNAEVWKPIEEAQEQKNKKFSANEFTVTVTGKFKNQDPEDCCIIASSQFEIQRVESAFAKPN